ncbi:hypothetical protein [Dyella kyungheensis]|jgi:hypothetical protein|uniref:Uncharacterized protein n=1 Tax=Dyella kyungheensis TaxID=1242174 RepID=A0ABS2JV56_9GAMM|nr:hypothetical protein [Dyella kyungheensis]MBM7122910.1 hypothetical protein [Dyella kyungheensis]
MNGDIDPTDPFFALPVEAMDAAGAHGSAPAAGADEPDPDWQPVYCF